MATDLSIGLDATPTFELPPDARAAVDHALSIAGRNTAVAVATWEGGASGREATWFIHRA